MTQLVKVFPHYKEFYAQKKAHEEATGYEPPSGGFFDMSKYDKEEKMSILVTSEIHEDKDYTPIRVQLSSKMDVWETRKIIAEATGVVPKDIRMSYAGKRFEENNARLEEYGVDYWYAKFPDWPIVMCKY